MFPDLAVISEPAVITVLHHSNSGVCMKIAYMSGLFFHLVIYFLFFNVSLLTVISLSELNSIVVAVKLQHGNAQEIAY